MTSRESHIGPNGQARTEGFIGPNGWTPATAEITAWQETGWDVVDGSE